MKLSRRLGPASLFTAAALLAACSSSAPPSANESGGGAITSTDGSPFEFRFDSEVLSAKETPVKNAAIAQLEYLQGILTTGEGGNAQFRFVDVTKSEAHEEGDKTRWTYSASVAVILPAGATVPETYDLAFPLDVTTLSAFADTYDGKCGKNAYGRETFWHDFNPKMKDCVLGDDVHKTQASVRKHPLATTDKYPEYDQIWADDSLDIVAVYGAISSTSDTDTGAKEREAFLAKVQGKLTDATRKEETDHAGIEKESIVEGSIEVGGKTRKVRMTAFFVSEAKSAGEVFETRFGAASENADFVLYSGHSGLGKNIAAIAKASHAKKGKYQIAFFNGCQTFGYLGPKMHQERIDLNGKEEDPNGTKFLDVIVTVLPAYSESTPTEQLMFDAMLEQTKGYEDLLKLFSGKQFIKHLTTVFGEDDNTFKP